MHFQRRRGGAKSVSDLCRHCSMIRSTVCTTISQVDCNKEQMCYLETFICLVCPNCCSSNADFHVYSITDWLLSSHSRSSKDSGVRASIMTMPMQGASTNRTYVFAFHVKINGPRQMVVWFLTIYSLPLTNVLAASQG